MWVRVVWCDDVVLIFKSSDFFLSGSIQTVSGESEKKKSYMFAYVSLF